MSKQPVSNDYAEKLSEMLQLVEVTHNKLEENEKKREEEKKKRLEQEGQEEKKKNSTEEQNSMSRAQILETLEKISEAEGVKSEERDERFKVPSLRFAHIDKVKYDEMQEEIDGLAEDILKKHKLLVQLVENIDIKAGSPDKFYIKITDENGNFVTMDLLNYQEKIYDYTVDEEESIKNVLVRLKGVYSQEIVNASKDLAEYISLALGYKQTFYREYKIVGWSKLDGNTIFKYDKIYSNHEPVYNGFCGEDWAEAITVQETDREKQNEAQKIWNDMMAETFNRSAVADIILCAAVSGIVRQSITPTKETNINMNIVAEKGSGKTTMQHLVLSFFGDPDKLEGSFIDTENASDQIRVERAVVPYVLDERMLKVESNGEKKKATEMLLSIFREYEGKIKSRLGSQYSNSNASAYGAIISSSVESLLDVINREYKETDENGEKTDLPRDLGQYRRFIEINTKAGDLFENANHAIKAEQISKNYYGYGVKQLIKYMLELMKYEKHINYLIDNYTNISLDALLYIINSIKNAYEEELAEALLCLVNKDKNKANALYTKLITEELTDGNNLKIFDKLFDVARKEVRETLETILDEEEPEKHPIYKEMQSSFQRFALLVLTGHLLNYSIDAGFEMDMEVVTNELILNLYNKLFDAKIFEKKERENRKKQQKQQEINVEKSKIQRVIDIYNWIKANESSFYVMDSESTSDTWIGRIEEDDTGLFKIAVHTTFGVKIFNAICGQSNPDDILKYRKAGKKEKVEYSKKCNIISDTELKDLILSSKGILYENTERDKNTNITIASKSAKGKEYIFNLNLLQQAQNELQSQEESNNETN